MAQRTKDGALWILAIDGGGVRGLIPSLILRELEEKLRSKGKQSHLGYYFDLIAGTSTGGIICLALCAPHRIDKRRPACSAEDLVTLYRNRAKDIFGSPIGVPIFGLTFDEKYDAAPLEGILDEILGDATTDHVISNFLITAYEIEDRKPKWFSNLRSDDKKPKYLLKELARATSAAPTFFEPARVEKIHRKGEYESLMDGGIFANNPSFIAYMHALDIGWPNDKIKVLSIGTGVEIRPYFYHEVKKWGNASWVMASKGVPLVSMLLQSQSYMVDRHMNLLLNSSQVDISKKRYFRIDGRLTKSLGSDDLDDVSEQNMKELEVFARTLIGDQNNQAILDLIASQL